MAQPCHLVATMALVADGQPPFAPKPNAQMKQSSFMAKHRMAQPCDYL
jgi:hypothetical protein